MFLHEAMVKLLNQTGKSMTTKEIAKELNVNKWYVKKDDSQISAFQIYRRANRHPELFYCEDTTLRLRVKEIITGTNRKVQKSESAKTSKEQNSELCNTYNTNDKDYPLIEKILMDENRFVNAEDISLSVLDKAGLYCIRIKDANCLPSPFNIIIKNRPHNITYIGITSISIRSRLLEQELWAEGHGTFFRSIGAVLGYRPPKGSLKNKKNKKNYEFSTEDKNDIINWIKNNLVVNCIEKKEGIVTFEKKLIQKYCPLLNLKHNPLALKELKDLRKECREIANS